VSTISDDADRDDPRPCAPPFPVAHSPNAAGQWHPLPDHLSATGRRAGSFAAAFGSALAGELLGLLHDCGKLGPRWQCYVKASAAGLNPATVDHKHAGAWLLARWGLHSLAPVILGHHGGMPDRAEVAMRLHAEPNADQLTAMRRTVTELGVQPPADPSALLPGVFRPVSEDDAGGWRRFEMWLRMLFSCLVDADHLDTAAHFRPGGHPVWESVSMAELAARCAAGVRRSVAERRGDPVAAARTALHAEVVAHAEDAPGWFELTAPTGSGKTIAAVDFALRHAAHHGLRRVVAAVPFVSVTEQIAGVYRGLVEHEGGAVVLEHHSGMLTAPGSGGGGSGRWARLAAENWDAPVVVTTMVQLLESLFDNRPGRTRKLHNIVGSVLIIDEVQALPWRLLDPTLDVLRELVRGYGCSVVLTTATQPPLDMVGSVGGVARRQLADRHWFEVFAGTTVRVELDPLDWDAVAARVATETGQHGGQYLVVLNTIGDARALTRGLAGVAGLTHLSSRLCPAHRGDVLAAVAADLAAGRPCVLVSTPLVEAGVDIDFPGGARAVGPAPAIAQVAGRVDRHGLRGGGALLVFDPSQGHTPPGEYALGTRITRDLLRTGADPLDPATINAYYQRLIRATADKLDSLNIQAARSVLNFATVARRYEVIAEDTTSVLVGYGPFRPERLTVPDDPLRRRQMLRRMQRFTVEVRAEEAVRCADRIEERAPGVRIWRGDYHPVYGLVTDLPIEERS
jgi:CRISPR-associated endonuclease/helicase Cas3